MEVVSVDKNGVSRGDLGKPNRLCGASRLSNCDLIVLYEPFCNLRSGTDVVLDADSVVAADFAADGIVSRIVDRARILRIDDVGVGEEVARFKLHSASVSGARVTSDDDS